MALIAKHRFYILHTFTHLCHSVWPEDDLDGGGGDATILFRQLAFLYPSFAGIDVVDTNQNMSSYYNNCISILSNW